MCQRADVFKEANGSLKDFFVLCTLWYTYINIQPHFETPDSVLGIHSCIAAILID